MAAAAPGVAGGLEKFDRMHTGYQQVPREKRERERNWHVHAGTRARERERLGENEERCRMELLPLLYTAKG